MEQFTIVNCTRSKIDFTFVTRGGLVNNKKVNTSYLKITKLQLLDYL